ncbi:hypothetical protein GCM10008957_52440 [Deinococcus ruber]|uniref:Transposase InsH N-terminal domain-containing protein n=1 Tax=Deinococcus ruber TaxID=1848197 RepID=A0A918KVU0_9DEIO|nr:hypothetical protein GCM10008957_52440 [Deinococcus ruber]
MLVFEFQEGLSDRQAADQVRARLDWKDVLGLELTDAGFDASVLYEFRTRLIDGACKQVLLDKTLSRFRAQDLLNVRGQQRTDSTPVIGAVRNVTRLELLGELVRSAPNELAGTAPAWLAMQLSQPWVKRSAHRVEEGWLPRHEAARAHDALEVGQDGQTLLQALEMQSEPSWRELSNVKLLRLIWEQQVDLDEQRHGRLETGRPPCRRPNHSVRSSAHPCLTLPAVS